MTDTNTRRVWRFSSLAHWRLAPGVWPTVLAMLLVAFTAPAATASTVAWVDTGGDCLRLRDTPGLNSGDISCLDHGTELLLLGPEQEQDGFTWLQVQHRSQAGWVAGFYVTTDPDEVQVIDNAPPPDGSLPPPPVGGMTMGSAGVTDLAMLSTSQPFDLPPIFIPVGVAKRHAAHSYSLCRPPRTWCRTTSAASPGFCCGFLPSGESRPSVRCGRIAL